MKKILVICLASLFPSHKNCASDKDIGFKNPNLHKAVKAFTKGDRKGFCQCIKDLKQEINDVEVNSYHITEWIIFEAVENPKLSDKHFISCVKALLDHPYFKPNEPNGMGWNTLVFSMIKDNFQRNTVPLTKMLIQHPSINVNYTGCGNGPPLNYIVDVLAKVPFSGYCTAMYTRAWDVLKALLHHPNINPYHEVRLYLPGNQIYCYPEGKLTILDKVLYMQHKRDKDKLLRLMLKCGVCFDEETVLYPDNLLYLEKHKKEKIQKLYKINKNAELLSYGCLRDIEHQLGTVPTPILMLITLSLIFPKLK